MRLIKELQRLAKENANYRPHGQYYNTEDAYDSGWNDGQVLKSKYLLILAENDGLLDKKPDYEEKYLINELRTSCSPMDEKGKPGGPGLFCPPDLRLVEEHLNDSKFCDEVSNYLHSRHNERVTMQEVSKYFSDVPLCMREWGAFIAGLGWSVNTTSKFAFEWWINAY